VTGSDRTFELFIDEVELRLVVDDDDARVTWSIPHGSNAAPGDVQLTDDKARELYRLLRGYFHGRNVQRAGS
jgi:hypothetical protein